MLIKTSIKLNVNHYHNNFILLILDKSYRLYDYNYILYDCYEGYVVRSIVRTKHSSFFFFF